jgi:hypothetical protein
MPLMKSPVVVLKFWKRVTSDYLKLNGLKVLPPQEGLLAKKFVKQLEALGKLARQLVMGKGVDEVDFNDVRTLCLKELAKLQKLFKPRKSMVKAKVFYLQMVHIGRNLKNLPFQELDAGDSGEPPAIALEDLDGEDTDSGDEGDAEFANVQAAQKKEKKRWQGQIKELMPRVLEAHKADHPDAAELTNLVSEAHDKVSARDFEGVEPLLDEVKKLLDKKVRPTPEDSKAKAVQLWRLARKDATTTLTRLHAVVAKSGHELAEETVDLIVEIAARIAKPIKTTEKAQDLANYLSKNDDINDLEQLAIDGKSYSIRPKLLKALAVLQKHLLTARLAGG